MDRVALPWLLDDQIDMQAQGFFQADLASQFGKKLGVIGFHIEVDIASALAIVCPRAKQPYFGLSAKVPVDTIGNQLGLTERESHKSVTGWASEYFTLPKDALYSTTCNSPRVGSG